MAEAEIPGFLTVREAADEMGRTPETIRRWVWAGKLAARKRGTRLVVSRADLERAAGLPSSQSLAAWLDQLMKQRATEVHTVTRSAADLVLADRHRRSSADARHAGR
jgi:excisionase family DNA binding protein